MSALGQLYEAWDTICIRMDNYGEELLNTNEEATRYALIDPILRSLGWDLNDPDQVRVECLQEFGGKPDYTLLKDNEIIAYIEAKKWGTINNSIKKLSNPLTSPRFNQLKSYCNRNSVRVGVYSDGGFWYIVDFSKKKPRIAASIDAAGAKRSDIKELLLIRR